MGLAGLIMTVKRYAISINFYPKLIGVSFNRIFKKQHILLVEVQKISMFCNDTLNIDVCKFEKWMFKIRFFIPLS